MTSLRHNWGIFHIVGRTFLFPFEAISCVITTVDTSPSSLNLWPPRFCFSFGNIRYSMYDDFAIYYILITNLMHWLLFIHKILFSSTCFEPQVLIFRRIQLTLCTDRSPGTLMESDSTIFGMYTTVSSWRWALEARNM